MNVLSLFTGIGGLDLGLERAGMTVVGQVEIDPWCRKVLAKHWPEVPRHDDVRTCAEWWLGTPLVADAEVSERNDSRLNRSCATPGDDTGPTVESEPRGSRGTERRHSTPTASRGRPAIDLVCGGFPCQPVSLAGKGLAQADSRWLWPAFAGVIRRLRPAYVLVENVPGLLGRGMGDVLGDLAGLGYDAEWDCVPAAFVGAPHIRNRVWIVAYPHGEQLRVRAGGIPATAGTGEGEAPERQRVRPDTRHDGQAVADAAGAGSPDGRTASGRRPGTPWRVEPQRLGSQVADADRGPLGWPPVPRCERGHWATEPGVGRVAHGIPARVDRLRGLGNAVVPQVAEHIGRLIMGAAA